MGGMRGLLITRVVGHVVLITLNLLVTRVWAVIIGRVLAQEDYGSLLSLQATSPNKRIWRQLDCGVT